MSFAPQQGAKIVSRYRLEQHLDSGGFGDAWLAQDTHSGRKVVAKVSHTNNYDIPVIEKQFEREWDVLEHISNAGDHSNVMSLIDTGTQGAHWYTIVEFIDGTEVHHYVRDNGSITDSDQLREIGMDVCDAMAFLHENELVYRDLKPDNVMFEAGLSPTLIDFNTARKMQPGQDMPTQFRGPFKAPEISGGQGDAGPWTDVYSIGKFIFYLMTANVERGDDVNPLDFGIQVDPYLAKIVERATSENPGTRYRNATVLKRALREREPTPPEQAELRWLQDNRTFSVHPGDTIGRDGGEAAIMIEDPTGHVSAVHAKFDKRGNDQWVVEDMSLNGTWIAKKDDSDFKHRALSDEGKRRLKQADKAPKNVDNFPKSIVVGEGDIIALVHPDHEIWLKVTLNN